MEKKILRFIQCYRAVRCVQPWTTQTVHKERTIIAKKELITYHNLLHPLNTIIYQLGITITIYINITNWPDNTSKSHSFITNELHKTVLNEINSIAQYKIRRNYSIGKDKLSLIKSITTKRSEHHVVNIQLSSPITW